MTDSLSLPDAESVRRVITAPPFVLVEGVPNLRELGGYTAGGHTVTKSAYVYRSADPSHITDKGKEQLLSLGIQKIFDLRAENEIQNLKSSSPAISGVESVKVSVSKAEAFHADNLAKDLQLFATDEAEAYRSTYTAHLESGGPAFGTIFKHVRDKPDMPFLVHCTAGKDRTGVFAALYLSLLGVSDEDIVKDYSLTTYGLVPALPILSARLMAQQVFRDNPEGAAKLVNSSPETMRDLLKILRDQFDGVEEYLKVRGGLTDDDIALVRRNAVVSRK